MDVKSKNINHLLKHSHLYMNNKQTNNYFINSYSFLFLHFKYCLTIYKLYQLLSFQQ